jgi:hypothetical protein
MRRRGAGVFLLVVLAPLGSLVFVGMGSAAPPDDSTTQIETVRETLAPGRASELSKPAPSTAARNAAAAGVLVQRDRLAALANATADRGGRPGEVDLTAAGPPETKLRAEQETIDVRKNRRNTVAQSVSGTLAEPAAAADGRTVFYSGNTYFSTSADTGSTWTEESVPGGPSEATIPCCDPDAVYSVNGDTTFNILLYTNAAQTNGVVRLFVRQGSLASPDCVYTIDPGGAANNVLPDYPHLAVSNSFLYLSTNNITNPSTWTGAQMRRFRLSQLSSCSTVTIDTFTHSGGGQRIHTPVEGATSTMYWGHLDSSTTFRIFSWPESTTTVSQTTRTVNASAFANPDCRGGTGNFDFVERSTSFSIAGFRMRGATGGGLITFLWPSSPVASQTQAHLRGITLNISLTVQAQPVVFNNSFCISYPALSSNSAGSLGLSVAFGGQAGGGGNAAQGAVAVDDTDSAGVFFPSLFLTAAGTHNRSDGRHGDYFTVRQSSRCSDTWVATNYALDGGNTNSSHVNARYIEFQSDDNPPCPK